MAPVVWPVVKWTLRLYFHHHENSAAPPEDVCTSTHFGDCFFTVTPLQTFEPPDSRPDRDRPGFPHRREADPRRETRQKLPQLAPEQGPPLLVSSPAPFAAGPQENAPQPIWIPGRNIRPATATEQAPSPQNEKPSSPDCPDVPGRHTSAKPVKRSTNSLLPHVMDATPSPTSVSPQYP
ncbi:uncharacterized protein LOC143644987 [Tamandua tetradactyla]|uniref:uncharacterized protein LOC143644987 n=1 Tax=Tamandua tetradactyla TaxID=48850 RepID=UPI004054236B